MPKSTSAYGAITAILLGLFIGAAIIGGMHFAPDVAIVRALAAVRLHSPQLTSAAIALTQLGSAWATLPIGIAAIAWLMLRGARANAAILAITMAVERAMVDGSKYLFGRPRPAFDVHPVTVTSASYPSGHSGNSMAVYLAIALVAVPPRWRGPAAVLAILTSVAIGLTRPFLGVHWPSDVVGGWAIGAAIALGAGRIADRRRLAAIEPQHQVVGGHRTPLGEE